MATRVPRRTATGKRASRPAGVYEPRLPAPPSDVRDGVAQAARLTHSPAPRRRKWSVERGCALSVSVVQGVIRAAAGPVQASRAALGLSGSAVQRAPWTTRVNWDASDLLGLERRRAGSPPPHTPRLGSGRGQFSSSGCLVGYGPSSHS